MKYSLSIIILSMLAVTGVNASELTGKISTDPQVLVNIVNEINSSQNNVTSISSGGSTDVPTISQNQEIATNYQTIRSVAGKKGARQIKVLGVSLYPNNSLLRDINHRIYLVKNGFKKHILSLKELQKYRGQDIYDVSSEELAYYQTRGHLDGELIKEKGMQRVFAIVNGRRQSISGPSELKKNYCGQEIFIISHEEMSLYK